MAPTRSPRGGVVLSALLLLATVSAEADDAAAPKATRLPYPYVRGKAYYVLPETHNNQSGYFSLCEGLDGLVYVGSNLGALALRSEVLVLLALGQVIARLVALRADERAAALAAGLAKGPGAGCVLATGRAR